MKNITKRKDNGSRKGTENLILLQNEKISILIEKEKERVRESESEDYVNELQINRQRRLGLGSWFFRCFRKVKNSCGQKAIWSIPVQKNLTFPLQQLGNIWQSCVRVEAFSREKLLTTLNT